MATTFSNKCDILSNLWIDYRDDESFKEFMKYNDIGLPLAYAITDQLATITDLGTQEIEETWEMLMGTLGIEDIGFENIDDVFGSEE
jgi:hypothetical protein